MGGLQLDANAFENEAKIDLYNCNTATSAKGREKMAKYISKKTKATVTGYEGKSEYRSIYSLWDKFCHTKLGIHIVPASYQPSGGFKNPDGVKQREDSVKKTYKNGEEVK